jgi:aldehyde:ferredoxin oxidoreductase
MAGGYAGKILRIDLTTQKVSTIDTAKYEEYGGGHGMGSAIFWDLVPDKTIKAFDPANVVTIMTSPLSGTLAPAVAGRTEITGIGAQGYPVEWYTRSNFGGRFAGQLKYAGWDGIVVQGKSPKPVWIDIRNDQVSIKSADGIWGLDTTEAQEEIWRRVQGDAVDAWNAMGASRDSGRTTQRPAVLTMGPSGETMSRLAALIHDAGNGAGQGAFGAVFGSKNLKAISVIGTGSVKVSDAKALMNARMWANTYGVGGHEKDRKDPSGSNFAGNPGGGAKPFGPPEQPGVPMGCLGCHKSCRIRWKSGASNGSSCVDYFFYDAHVKATTGGKATQAILDSTELLQRAGLNAYQMEAMILWLIALNKKGIVGPGKHIDTDLPFAQLGQVSFVQALIDKIEKKQDIGADLHEGLALAAVKWGRYDEDTTSGILPLQVWNYPQHYDARTEVEWGYGSMLGDRDINEHDFNNFVFWNPSIAALYGIKPAYTAEKLSQIFAEKLSPYNDPMMLDYSDEGIYSEAMAKTVAWHRHYTRYFKQSLNFCDWAWSDIANPYGPDSRGMTGEGEPKFFNAVTGKKLTFLEGMEIGRKIWNLDRAIWILQGRTREMEVLTGFNYEQGAVPGYTTYEAPYTMPVHENGQWSYKSVAGRKLDRQKVEDWKTKFYALEGWDTKTGWPTRKTLSELGLGFVADELAKSNKLGS